MTPRRVLMVAYHFPPHAGSSGIQRTLRFVRHLPRFGWEPIVLTASECAYANVSDTTLADIPRDTAVHRAWALDTKLHLSIAGRYPHILARPDRWCSWWLPGAVLGARLARRYDVDAIWSTFPIGTAHLIGASLARLTGRPWVADLRDPMLQDDYPSNPALRRSYARIEDKLFNRASAVVTVTHGSAAYYANRFPEAASRLHVIRNAHDEEVFAEAERVKTSEPLVSGRFTLLHSGLIYRSERDPTQLFEALADLRRTHPDHNLCLRMRGCNDEAWLRGLADQYGLADVVEILPALSYKGAIAEMFRADALLILQAANCNMQIPAKLYEYARTGRPVIALTDPEGDTQREVLRMGAGRCAPLDSSWEIHRLLADVLQSPRQPSRPAPDTGGYLDRTAELAALLERVSGSRKSNRY